MKNYFTFERFSLLYDHYAFIDVPEYYADQLFIQHQVTVRFGKEFQHPDQPYVIIFCKGTLLLTYEEREERIYDCKPLLEQGGVFVHLRKYENFARAFIDFGAVCWDIDPNVDSNVVWNNRIDLCPDTCYINSVPVCAKGLTREEMLEAKTQCWLWVLMCEKKMLLRALLFHAEFSA